MSRTCCSAFFHSIYVIAIAVTIIPIVLSAVLTIVINNIFSSSSSIISSPICIIAQNIPSHSTGVPPFHQRGHFFDIPLPAAQQLQLVGRQALLVLLRWLLALPQLRHQSPGLDAIGYFHLLNILMIVHPPDHPAATTARAHRLSQALPPAHPARRCSCSSSRTLSRRSPT